jgi:hypothetical protein
MGTSFIPIEFSRLAGPAPSAAFSPSWQKQRRQGDRMKSTAEIEVSGVLREIVLSGLNIGYQLPMG